MEPYYSKYNTYRRTWLRSCTPILDVNMEKDDKARFMRAYADH